MVKELCMRNSETRSGEQESKSDDNDAASDDADDVAGAY